MAAPAVPKHVPARVDVFSPVSGITQKPLLQSKRGGRQQSGPRNLRGLLDLRGGAAITNAHILERRGEGIRILSGRAAPEKQHE